MRSLNTALLVFEAGSLLPPLSIAACLDLQALAPTRFAGWKMDNAIGPIMANPTQQAALASVYRQTLARTCKNKSGERVMLSIAYGGDQSANSMQAHRPGYCHAAQGFQIQSGQAAEIDLHFGKIPVTRPYAAQDAFIKALVGAMDASGRQRIAGLPIPVAGQ